MFLFLAGACDDNPVNRPETWEMVVNTDVHPLEGSLRVTYHDKSEEGEPVKTQCLTQVTNVTPKHKDEQMPQLMECDDSNHFQRWRWQYKFDFNYDFQPPSTL